MSFTDPRDPAHYAAAPPGDPYGAPRFERSQPGLIIVSIVAGLIWVTSGFSGINSPLGWALALVIIAIAVVGLIPHFPRSGIVVFLLSALLIVLGFAIIIVGFQTTH